MGTEKRPPASGRSDTREAHEAPKTDAHRSWSPSRARRLRFRLHHRWPSLFPDKEAQRNILSFYDAQRDADENAESALPTGQQVRVEAIWVAEVFPPSAIGGLYADLAKLGWDSDPDRAGGEPISHYVREHRRSTGGGWVPLPLILRPGDNRFLGGHRRADLPKGVDRAHAVVYSPYPSVSIIVIEFILDDAASTRLDHALRADYRTEVTPVGVGLTIATPAWRKQREGAIARSEMRQTCRNFMRCNLHGRFAAAADGMSHPVLELISTTKGVVLGDDASAQWSLSRLLGISWRFDSWTTRRGPTVRLRMSAASPDPDTNTLLMNVNRFRMVAEAKKRGYGIPTAPDLLAHAGDELTALWAIRLLLDGYHAELGDARDHLLAPSRRSPARDAIKKLRAIDDTVLALSGDVRVVTADVAQFAHRGHTILTRESPQFLPMEKAYGGTRSFSQVLLDGAKSQAESLRSGEAELRDLLTVDASTKGAIANINLQRWVIGWTMLISVLTAFLVWLAIATLNAASGHH
jgi:hypothetical protein